LKIEKHRILGIDPGTNFLGYAVLEIDGRAFNLITMSILTLTHVDDPSEKLKRIFEKVAWVIDTFQPKEMAIEEPFYAKNVQSMLKFGRAQGVAMAAAMVNGLPVAQYLPKTVKKSVVGNGNASKEQVAAMLGHILKRPIEPSYFDASDALAVAICHHYQSNSALGGGKKHDSWAAFAKANAEKIKK
jgi:crossover junction endodeoxyribonuclease RuvC